MEIVRIDFKEDNVARVRMINDLVEQSFGDQFSANCFWKIIGGTYCEDDQLGMIYNHSKKELIIPYVGCFSAEDGSEIHVQKDYENNAQKYAELYEKIFPAKRVKIFLHELPQNRIRNRISCW